MQKQEFEKRTPFLDEADREHYAEWYEPAYMAVSGIDKDKFCKMLKDETVRTFVREVSIAITTADNRERETNNQLVDSVRVSRWPRSRSRGCAVRCPSWRRTVTGRWPLRERERPTWHGQPGGAR